MGRIPACMQTVCCVCVCAHVCVCVCACVRACVLTVPGSPDNIHVLLKVLDYLCQDAVLLVNVLQDLSPVVDVATS